MLYIILSPFFALVEVVIALNRYFFKEIIRKIHFVRSNTNKSFRSLSAYNVKVKEHIETMTSF